MEEDGEPEQLEGGIIISIIGSDGIVEPTFLMLRKSMDTWGKTTAVKLQRRPSKVDPNSNKGNKRSTPPQQQETSLSNKTVDRNKCSK